MVDLLQYDPKVTSYTATQREGKLLDVDPNAPRVFDHYFAPDSARWWKGGKQPRRDSFRQRSYDAEDSFRARTEFKTFANVAEVARYVRDVMETPYFQRRFPLFRSCEVEYRKSSRTCSGGPREYTGKKPWPWPLPNDVEVTAGHITMSTFGMRELGEVGVLHELAHAALPSGHRHDRRWARTFIELVSGVMGIENKKLLAEQFKLRHIPFSPVRRVKEKV